MAAQSKACFTVISYQENMDFFNTSVEKEFDFWDSQKAAGIAVGMHHREVDDKNHDHWMIGWSKSAPSTTDFVKLLKARNAELIADAKSHGKDVTITLDDGSTVERQFYKIYTGRYANKHCVFNPEALNDYLSHSTKNAQAENKVQYDPDKDVIYSDGFDLDAYLSRDAVAKAKKDEQKDDALLMADIYDMVRDTGITNIIDLSQYVRRIGRMDLLNYMHAHSATVHFAINDEYRDNHNGKVPYTVEQECKENYPHGTNSVDAGEIPPKNDNVPDLGCLKSEIFYIIQNAGLAIDDELYNKFFEANSYFLMNNSCDKCFADIVLAKYRSQIVTSAVDVPAGEAPAADAPAEDAPADVPASTDADPCVEGKNVDSSDAREIAPEDEHSPLPAEGASRKARVADTFISPSVLKLLAEDDSEAFDSDEFEVFESDEIAGLFDD